MTDRARKLAILQLLNEKERRHNENKLASFYPDEGKLSRANYPRHMEFFRAGATYPIRAFMAANGVGKTEGAGAPEMTWHATGRYPKWWEGKRFKRPIKGWFAGDTLETVKTVIQPKLLGLVGDFGTGIIPKDAIHSTKMRRGDPECVEVIRVKHVSGGISELRSKSYEQGEVGFKGAEVHVIWLDEDPRKRSIFTECMLRSRTVEGIIMMTFTPDRGLTETALMFLPGLNPEMSESEMRAAGRYCVHCDWDQAPHLTEADKARYRANMKPHEKSAREKGIPSVGESAVYPVDPDDIKVAPFELPPFWPRVYGLDVGWERTAAVWAAHDRERDIVYFYREYYRGHLEPERHALNIKKEGEWIPGVVDPASNTPGQKDGDRLYRLYKKEGLKLSKSDNALEAGIGLMLDRLMSGRLLVFSSCVNFFSELALYRRDESNAVAKKQRDHLMDAARYVMLSGLKKAKTRSEMVALSNRSDNYHDLRFGTY